MLRVSSTISFGMAGCLLAIGLAADVCAQTSAQPKSPTRLALPSIVSLEPGRGPMTLPRLLTSTDVTIGDPSVSYVDPEFLPDERLMVWQDAGCEVWLCSVDPDTGGMVPANGKGQFAGRAAPLLTKRNPLLGVTYNGPEFGISRQGIVVYYSDSEQLEIARYDLASQRIDIPVPGTTRNTRALIASKDHDDPGTRVMYLRVEGAAASANLKIVNEWFDDSDLEVVHPLPLLKSGTSGPQWIPGQRAIIAQLPDQSGVEQVCRYDIDAGQFTLLTDTPGNKIDSFAFAAPEYPGELVFLTLNERKWLEAYRLQGSQWTRILHLPAPGTSANSSSGLKSPEPVVYRGRTYITYLADFENTITRGWSSMTSCSSTITTG